ncbi:MAG: hypothetical protein EB164_09455 [Thaumarchaeota archaeon]|nr:hypothetical protein [Nitrososphaerota archaeon]
MTRVILFSFCFDVMTKINVKKLIVLAMSASLFATVSIPNAIAVEEPRILLGLDSVNEVALTTTFHYSDGDETIDTFKVYRPLSAPTGTKLATSVADPRASNTGFDSRASTPRFILEKVVGDETPLLYRAVDEAHDLGSRSGKGGTGYFGTDFKVDVTFQRGATPLRTLHYDGCVVYDYYPYTEFDAEETYNQKTKFVYIDAFTFECRGITYENPVYNQILADKQKPPYAQ